MIENGTGSPVSGEIEESKGNVSVEGNTTTKYIPGFVMTISTELPVC